MKGLVTVEGRPVSGVLMTLVDLRTGALHRARTGARGDFQVALAPGEYAITGGGDTGLTVGRGPTSVSVMPGQVVSARLDLVALPVVRQTAPPPESAPPQAPPAEATTLDPGSLPPPGPSVVTATTADGTATMHHEPVGCFVVGEFPLLDAEIEPASAVARARVYFKATGSHDWFFVEMTAQEGRFFGKLPRPRLEASPVSYYIQATTTEFGETQTPELAAVVVSEPKQCPQDRKLAAFGPAGAVQVFSAATGSVIAPVGFAAAGGLALTGGIVALVAGAAAVGIGTAIVINNASPTPEPAPSPAATPIPFPSPSPIPTPSPSPSDFPSPVPSLPPTSPIR